MKNILVTGCDGQLGSEFIDLAYMYPNLNFFFKNKELDITFKKEIEYFLKENNINFIINTAAYTDVNKAEVERDKADLINEKGLKNLVELSEKYNCRLIHYSTDYVYNGKDKIPISENEKVNPLNYYGISKRNGEMFIEKSKVESIVIRTSWLYSNFGNNFVNSVLKKIDNKEKIFVVNDQFGCPTYARDLALDTIKIINSKIKLDIRGKIYNYSNLGYTNWSDFAKKIIELLDIDYKVHDVPSNFFKTIADRPKFSITDKRKIINVFNLKIQKWDESLKTYLTNFHK